MRWGRRALLASMDIEFEFTGLFAGKPAPTGTAQALNFVKILWERVHPRMGLTPTTGLAHAELPTYCAV